MFDETIEGKNPVLEALRAGREINKIFIADTARDKAIMQIKQLAKENKIPVQMTAKEKIEELADTKKHQGVIAMASAKQYVELEEIMARETGQLPLIVMVDGLEDPHNLGAIIRTCEAVGVQGVVIPNRRNVGLTFIVSKVSAGAIEHIPVARVVNLVQTMVTLKENGYWIVGCEASADETIYEADFDMPIVLVIGGEGKGIGRLVREHCDFLVKLPMLGKVNSLNASVAASVCLYEILRKRKYNPKYKK